MSEFEKWYENEQTNPSPDANKSPTVKNAWQAALEWAMTQIHAAYTIPLFNAEKEIAKELKELNDGNKSKDS